MKLSSFLKSNFIKSCSNFADDFFYTPFSRLVFSFYQTLSKLSNEILYCQTLTALNSLPYNSTMHSRPIPPISKPLLSRMLFKYSINPSGSNTHLNFIIYCCKYDSFLKQILETCWIFPSNFVTSIVFQ